MARHGPILNDNEAMGPGNVYKYFPDLRDTIFISEMPAEVPKSQNTVAQCSGCGEWKLRSPIGQ